MQRHIFSLLILLSATLACMATVPKTPKTGAPNLPTAFVVTAGPVTLPTSTSAVINPNPTILPVSPTSAGSAEKYRIHIRMTTTSDWSTFGLVDGATWRQSTLISASSEATFNWLENHRFLLSQPIERAEAGESVEMVFETHLFNVESGGMIIFEIERGHIGSTQVEVSNYLGDKAILVETLVWDKINPGERNAQRFEIPTEKLTTKTP